MSVKVHRVEPFRESVDPDQRTIEIRQKHRVYLTTINKKVIVTKDGWMRLTEKDAGLC